MGKLEFGIDDQLHEWFARKAKRLGQTDAEYARTLVEREARSEQTWQNLENSNTTMRERMKTLARYQTPKRMRK